MSKSVELLSRSEDGEPSSDQRHTEERSRLNLNGSRQLSRSATELRDSKSDTPNESPVHRTRDNETESITRHRHRHASVAQRTQTFFATLKSRWARSRSKERKKSKDASSSHAHDSYKNPGLESDYAADYSSEHSRSSSATHSPAKHYLNHPESPLTRTNREKIGNLQEDSSGRCSDGSSKGSSGFQGHKDASHLEEAQRNGNKDSDILLQDETTRRRELALRQHAFFQLRLHIRRGANLVAMDRCGASDPYVKIKSAGHLLHKSRTVHRELNPVWDESVTLPIEDPFQPLTVKVFDYDWGLQDDFMGAATLDLTLLDLGHAQDITLELKDPARPRQHLGEIFLTATLWPRNQQEKEQERESSGGKRRSSSGRILDRIAETLRKNDHPDKVEVILDRNFLQKDLSDTDLSARTKKDKRIVNSLKECIDKKKELIEKILEDRVEKIWEDKIERHPWLQPIEAWIIERQNRSSKSNFERGYSSESEVKGDFREEALKETRSRFQRKTPVRRRAIRCQEKVPSKIDDATREASTSIGDDQKDRSLESPNDLQDSTKSSVSSLNDSSIFEKHVEKPLPKDDERSESPDFFDKIKENFKDKIEDIHRYFQRSNRLADVNRKLKSQIWSSVVTIVLVEAKNLLPMDIEGLSDPYVKFRLGTEKYKSKVANKTLNPVWLEQFDLHLYEDPYLGQDLEVTVWDRDKSHQDDLMGKTIINLAILERELTHRLWRELEDGAGSIFLLLTISGTTASETISDLAAHEDNAHERNILLQRYSVMNTLQRPRDVGHLIVKVFRAQGLAAADLGGKSDPFCVLELVNARLQTQTEYKTLAPNWQKIFTFNVKDINSVLEVTVYDEDRDHKVEFLGKVAIPLLKIRNGEKRWYALKDKKLRGRAKGNSPQILLEMTVVWNVFRACIRTVNPKEKKYMEPEMKFKRQVFLRNVLRLKAIIVIFIDLGKYIQSCFEWESKMRSIIALVLFVLGCYYFEPYMIPTALLLILLKYYVVAVLTGAPIPHQVTVHVQDTTDTASDDGPPTPGDDDDDDDDKDKEEKKSLKERLQAIQEVTQTVQNSIGYLASLCEKVKNLFNFTVPYLSYLAMIMTILGAVVLYIIPVRYLILAWGVNKFSRKIFRPHSVPNNEVLDLISRVPDDEELLNYRELKPLPTADCEKGASASTSGNLSRRELRKRHKAA